MTDRSPHRPRRATRQRRTKETADRRRPGARRHRGRSTVATGLPFFDHMLVPARPARRLRPDVKAAGRPRVDAHHTVEDVGIVLGEALAEALGDKAGVRRFASIALPLDEALSRWRSTCRAGPTSPTT